MKFLNLLKARLTTSRKVMIVLLASVFAMFSSGASAQEVSLFQPLIDAFVVDTSPIVELGAGIMAAMAIVWVVVKMIGFIGNRAR